MLLGWFLGSNLKSGLEVLAEIESHANDMIDEYQRLNERCYHNVTHLLLHSVAFSVPSSSSASLEYDDTGLIQTRRRGVSEINNHVNAFCLFHKTGVWIDD